jgi:hypothetical protein
MEKAVKTHLRHNLRDRNYPVRYTSAVSGDDRRLAEPAFRYDSRFRRRRK